VIGSEFGGETALCSTR